MKKKKNPTINFNTNKPDKATLSAHTYLEKQVNKQDSEVMANLKRTTPKT